MLVVVFEATIEVASTYFPVLVLPERLPLFQLFESSLEQAVRVLPKVKASMLAKRMFFFMLLIVSVVVYSIISLCFSFQKILGSFRKRHDRLSED